MDTKTLLSPEVRTWIYGIVTAVIPLLSAYGILSEEQVPLWVALAAAFFATGTALAYRPTRNQPEPPAGRHEASSLENAGE